MTEIHISLLYKVVVRAGFAPGLPVPGTGLGRLGQLRQRISDPWKGQNTLSTECWRRLRRVQNLLMIQLPLSFNLERVDMALSRLKRIYGSKEELGRGSVPHGARSACAILLHSRNGHISFPLLPLACLGYRRLRSSPLSVRFCMALHGLVPWNIKMGKTNPIHRDNASERE